MVPDNTGRARQEPYDIIGTNDLFQHLIGVLADPASSQEHGFFGAFSVPVNYNSAPEINVVWSTTATSGNARMRTRYRAVGGDDTESLDQGSYQETVAVTDAAPSAAHERMEATMALTAGNIAAEDLFEFYLTRLDDSGTDTLAAAVQIHDVLFEYLDADG
jgi:hypothetical protein